jgi:DNA invertase Pin-like site-specific DNA recombinase
MNKKWRAKNMATPKKNFKAAVYIRVGTEKQLSPKTTALYCRTAVADDINMALQISELHRYAEINDYSVCTAFHDNGVSGVTLDRPGLSEMVKQIIDGEIERVIIRDIARLSRSIIQFHELTDLFEMYGVELISMTDGILV